MIAARLRPPEQAAAATVLVLAATLLLTIYCQLIAFDEPTPLAVSVRWAVVTVAGWMVFGACLWAARRWIAARITSRNSTDLASTTAGLFFLALAVSLASSMILSGLSGYDIEASAVGQRVIRLLPILGPLAAAITLGLSLLHWRRAADQTDERSAPFADAAGGAWLQFPEEPRLRLKASDVLLIRTAGNYCELKAGTRNIAVRATAKALEKRLEPHGFARVHRRAIVNLGRVRALRPCRAGRLAVELDDGTELTVSRAYRASLRRLMS